jgi:SpoVK/Ycf46/Vps4 family AAA+-type ATPase
MKELSRRIKAVRKEHEAGTGVSWPSLNWRSISQEGCFEIWWSLPAGFDTSVLVDTMIDEIGGEMSVSRVPQQQEASLHRHSRRTKSTLICDSSMSTQLLVQKSGRRPRILLRKYGRWRESDIRAIVRAYKASSLPVVQASDRLTRLGIRIFGADPNLSWCDLGGYDELKTEVQSNVVLALEHPAFFDEIAQATREKPASNRPKAVLFEGAPGTGKTTVARIIASSIHVPLIVIPLEAVLSKWYGESEKLMASIFDAIDEIGDAVVFIDEIDSIVSSSANEMQNMAYRPIFNHSHRCSAIRP